jgi:hypothetical protein
MQNPMMRIGIEMSGQPHEIATGPPSFHAGCRS